MYQNVTTVTNLDMTRKTFAIKSGKKNQGTTRRKIIKRNTITSKITITKKGIDTGIKRQKNDLQKISQKKSSKTDCLLKKCQTKNIPEKKFIADSGVTSHMVNLEENIKNLNDAGTQSTVGDSITLTSKKRDNCNGYQKHDGILNQVILSDASIIPILHKNLFSITQSPQKGFQVMPGGEALILKKIHQYFIWQENGKQWRQRISFDHQFLQKCKKLTLFSPPISGSLKGRKRYSRKVQKTRIKNKWQPNN